MGLFLSTAQPAPSSPFANLPEPLLHRIISLLQPLELARARCVCKSWHSAIPSSDLLRLHEQLHAPLDSWLYFVSCSSTSTVFTWSSLHSEWRSFRPPNRCYLRAGDGIMCMALYSVTDLNSRNRVPVYIVGNPFTDSWKRLPLPIKQVTGGMCPIATCDGGKRFWISILHKEDPSSLEVYDSESDCWSLREFPYVECPRSTKRWPSSIRTESTRIKIRWTYALVPELSAIGHTIFYYDIKSKSIYTLDMKRYIWTRMEAQLPEELGYIIVCMGKMFRTRPMFIGGPREQVLLVGCVPSPSSYLGSHVPAVLRWDKQGKKWRESSRMPSKMFILLVDEAYPESDEVLFMGVGGLVFVYIYGGPSIAKFSPVSRTWSWLDRPPAMPAVTIDPFAQVARSTDHISSGISTWIQDVGMA